MSFETPPGRSKVFRDARIRRGLPADPKVPNSKKASIQPDDGRGSWAGWSRDAFHGGYLTTTRRYAWRAIRSEPFAVASWKAILREYFRGIRQSGEKIGFQDGANGGY